MTRILIAGGPRTGKTTGAKELGAQLVIPVFSTDDLIGKLDWSAASAEVAKWFDEKAQPWIIEGVAVPRAIRKWLAAHPTGKPADRIIWRDRAFEELTSGQLSMRKGCVTVWNEIVTDLLRRGVAIESPDSVSLGRLR